MDKKVAKLVYLNLLTRVVVDEDATEEEIIKASRHKFIDKVSDESFGENIEDIVDDEECPYDPEFDEEWIIRNKLNNGDFWNNWLGWTEFKNKADVFTGADKKVYNLPIDGEWIKK